MRRSKCFNLILPTVAVALIVASCSGRHSASKSADSTSTDSTETTSIESQPTLVYLPDTVYPSASAVRHNIEICDTTTFSSLASLNDSYDISRGLLTFRGGALRNADFHGTLNGTPSTIEVDWRFKTKQARTSETQGSWGGGSGWTGQPLYIEWPDSCIKRFQANDSLTENFSSKEIIVGSLDGNVYFIDFNTGKASRNAIDVINPIKGTISLDPSLNGNLYVGQGIPIERPFGALVIDLNSHKITHTFPEDPKAQRRWGAYDSSPLRIGQFLFRPGENGTIYKFLIKPGGLSLHSTLRYTVNGSPSGIEASMSAFANYGYTADNHGNVICINLNTLRPVWHYAMGDDTDATPTIIPEEGHPYVYTGSEIDRQEEGFAKFVKLDGLTGKPVWETKLPGLRADINEKHFDGGFYSSPLPGSGNCSHLIFANMVENLDGQNGKFVAFDRTSGNIVYSTPLRYYAWSSPVGLLNEKSEMFVFTGDCSGNAYIINGINGKILHRAHIGSNFESSPIVVGNSIIVGSRGDTIFKMSIK